MASIKTVQRTGALHPEPRPVFQRRDSRRAGPRRGPETHPSQLSPEWFRGFGSPF
jgi:hypothetical protein